jgi:hypothetical protein
MAGTAAPKSRPRRRGLAPARPGRKPGSGFPPPGGVPHVRAAESAPASRDSICAPCWNRTSPSVIWRLTSPNRSRVLAMFARAERFDSATPSAVSKRLKLGRRSLQRSK